MQRAQSKRTIKNILAASLLTASILLYFLHAPLVNADTPYAYLWKWTGTTVEYYDTKAPTVMGDPFDTSHTVAQAKVATIVAITDNLTKGFAEKGIIAVITLIVCNSMVQTTTEQSMGPGPGGGQIPYTTYHHKLLLDVSISFNTNTQIMPGQLDPVSAAIIIKVVAAIIWALVAIYAITLLVNWLKSMTTTTSTITKYDEHGNPIETITTTGPDYGGIISLGITGAIVLGVCYVVAYIFLGVGRKKKR